MSEESMRAALVMVVAAFPFMTTLVVLSRHQLERIRLSQLRGISYAEGMKRGYEMAVHEFRPPTQKKESR